MENRVTCLKDGPLEIHGPVRIEAADGGVTQTTAMVHHLCRCGASRVMPFCDGTHVEISFTAE